MDANLLLDGGGVKALGLVGAVSVLEEAGYRFHQVAGISAGSVVGSLLASGLTCSELEHLMGRTDYRRFQDKRLLSRVPVVGKPLALAWGSGLHRGAYLKEWLAAMLEERGVRTFGDLRVPGRETFAGEPAYKLVVIAVDVSRGAVVRFPWDYELYGLDPDEQLVVDAVQASAAIPFYYRPVTLRHGDGQTSLLCDVGFLGHFPMDVFDGPRSGTDGYPTIGIKLNAPDRSPSPVRRIRGPIQLGRQVASTIVANNCARELDRFGAAARTVFVTADAATAVDFDLDEDVQAAIYRQGRRGATEFLNRAEAAVDRQVAALRVSA
jgi:NTE family protein